MPSEYKLVLKHVDQAGYSNDIKCYQKHGGYKTMKKVFKLKAKKTKDGVTTPQEIIRKEVLVSGLRGRGGAGFSAGMKWSFVDKNLASRFILFVMLMNLSLVHSKIVKLCTRIPISL